MLCLKSYLLYLALAGCSLLFTVAAAQRSGEIRYTQAATIPFDWDSLSTFSRSFADTLTGDVICKVRTLDSIPLFYAKDIFTSVCFDNQCRKLDITIFWNITGRYLGFKLSEKEFLSRYDHEPFTSQEYVQLNGLLADPYLPFANVSFEELVGQPAREDTGFDGVSGATSSAVSDFVVEGAAYTTYTMWNIIYGPTRALIGNLTEQEITQNLLTLILNSPSSEDRIWGLDKIDTFVDLDTNLMDALLENVRSEEFFVAYAAINAITPKHLNSESLQNQLFSIYEKANYNLRKSIIEKLNDALTISPGVIDKSQKILKDLNGEQLGYILDLYNKHAVDNVDTHKEVAKLLHSNNRFISQKAYSYLVNAKDLDSRIIDDLKIYEQAEKQ